MALAKHEFVDDYPYLVYTDVQTCVYSDKADTSIDDISPEGTISITENGEGINVAQYAYADVNVSGGGDIPVGYYFIHDYVDNDYVVLDKTWSEINSMWSNGSGFIILVPRSVDVSPYWVTNVGYEDSDYYVGLTNVADPSIETEYVANSADSYPSQTVQP